MVFEKRVKWQLRNTEGRSLARYLKRLGNILLRNSPNEYVILNVTWVFKDGHVERQDVNRHLDKARLKILRRFLKRNEDSLDSFQIRFISFAQRDNIQILLNGEAPFEELQLYAQNLPKWMHEMTNRSFREEITWRQKLWSYLYNHRPFKHHTS